MKYLAILHAPAPAGFYAEGAHDTEEKAIAMAFADSDAIRAIDPTQVALCMYHHYENGNVLSYACTLAQYRDATS